MLKLVGLGEGQWEIKTDTYFSPPNLRFSERKPRFLKALPDKTKDRIDAILRQILVYHATVQRFKSTDDLISSWSLYLSWHKKDQKQGFIA